MSHSQFLNARRPKIEGTQNLHNYFLSRSIDLDLFVMLSSLAGIMGNPTQSNYAAGNTFQDALAHHRRSKGLPALTIDVGMVTDTGWTAQNRDRIGSRIMFSAKDITTKDLMALVEHHLIDWLHYGKDATSRSPSPQVSVGVGDCPAVDARFSHVRANEARFVPSAASDLTSSKQESLEARLATVGKDDRQRVAEVIEEAFSDKLARLLSLAPENVHLTDSLASHGVDSLVAVEIRTWFRKEIGVNVAVSEILNGQRPVRDVVSEIAGQRAGA